MDGRKLLTRITVVFGIIARIVFAVMVFLFAIGVGWYVGLNIGNIYSAAESQKVFGAFLGAGFLLASLEKLLNHLPGLVRWIRTGDFGALYTISSFAFMLFLSLGAAAWVAVGETPESVPLVTQPTTAPYSSVVFVNGPTAEVPPPSPDTKPYFIIPFFKEAGGCSETDALYKKGTDLDPSTTAFIRDLAKGLSHCASSDRFVTLTARGFASSKPFDCKDPKESDRLNKQIANDRAVAVADVFETAVTQVHAKLPLLHGRVTMSVIPWKSVDDMYAKVGFDDRNAGTYSHDRAVLTRRVEVVIEDAGDCRAITPPSVPTASSDSPSQSADAPARGAAVPTG